MIETDGRNGILVIDSISNGFYKSSFACILKSNNCDLEFFIEEPVFNPVDDFIEEPKHRDIIATSIIRIRLGKI